MGPSIPYKNILKMCKHDSNCTQGSSKSMLQILLDTTKQGKNRSSRIRSRARCASVQQMHLHLRLPLKFPYAAWLLPQPRRPSNTKNGTVQPARTSQRSNGEFGIDGQRAKYNGWSAMQLLGAKIKKQRMWSGLTVEMAEEYTPELAAENRNGTAWRSHRF